MKLLVIPDVHGRGFWKKPCSEIEKYDSVIFLGDYMDPYDFEGITVEDAIKNFKEILDFSRNHSEKVVMLVGNHDLPYYDINYRNLSSFHCRIAPYNLINEIVPLYKLYDFKLTQSYDNILFSHAGVQKAWLEWALPDYKFDGNVDVLSEKLNSILIGGEYGKLLVVSYSRGGYGSFGSCVWSDVGDQWYEQNEIGADDTLSGLKQVFGHTLQARIGRDGKVEYLKPVEFSNMKMLDNAHAYELDTFDFTINAIQPESF